MSPRQTSAQAASAPSAARRVRFSRRGCGRFGLVFGWSGRGRYGASRQRRLKRTRISTGSHGAHGVSRRVHAVADRVIRPLAARRWRRPHCGRLEGGSPIPGERKRVQKTTARLCSPGIGLPPSRAQSARPAPRVSKSFGRSTLRGLRVEIRGLHCLRFSNPPLPPLLEPSMASASRILDGLPPRTSVL
jgi:hypothetical protein